MKRTTPPLAPPSIDRSVLRDHAQSEGIDRVWERLERNLVLSPPSKAPRPRRWQLVAAAAAAGFAVGFVVNAAIQDAPPPSDGVAIAPEEDESKRELFAASEEPRVYALPGGGFIRLEPQSIVDTVTQGQNGLTLRLVRGEATLSTDSETHGRRTTRVALQVGRAEVATAAGSMRVRLDGDSADLEVYYGTAALTAPDEEVKHRVLHPGRQRLRVRVVTASTEPTAIAPSRLTPPSDVPVDGVVAAEEGEVVVVEEPVVQTKAAWMEACDKGDYASALELVQREPGGADAALANVSSPALLACLGTGHDLARNVDAAIAMNERVMRESNDKQYRVSAAYALARLYADKGDVDQSAHWRRVAQEESQGALLSAEALCNKIQASHQTNNRPEVARLSKLYRQQFPDGDCIDIIGKIEAELRAKGEPESPPSDETSDDVGEGGSEP